MPLQFYSQFQPSFVTYTGIKYHSIATNNQSFRYLFLISYCDKFVQYHLQQNARAVITHYNAVQCK